MLHKTAQRIRRHKRIRKGIHGTADTPRLSVFRSNAHIYAQLIDDEKNTTILSASDVDKEVKKMKADEKAKGFTKINTSHLVGKALADKAKAKKITKVIFDRGGFLYTGRVKAVAEGAREGGLTF